MSDGYNGKVLRVDLSTRAVSIDRPGERFYRSLFGGWGVIAHELLASNAASFDPLDARNPLVFATGVLTGAPVPGSGRHAVGARSPLTLGFGEADVGGFWGTELKQAGFDAVVITGRSESPVYVWIHDAIVEIRDAAQLWGKDAAVVQAALQQELGDDKIRVAQCGIAGENLVRFACVIHDVNRAAGRCGLGAVMGSKSLKAVVVRGTGSVPVADSDSVKKLSGTVNAFIKDHYTDFTAHGTSGNIARLQEAGQLPTRNFRDATFSAYDRIDGHRMSNMFLEGRDTCYACPIACKRKVRVNGEYTVDPVYGGPEYDTVAALGSCCGIDDLEAILYASQLCNAYGLDTISTGVTIAWLMECFERGLVAKSDTCGTEIRFGDAAGMVRLVEQIAHREGLGALLADGSKRASRSLGRGTEAFAVHVKGQEAPMHDPRVKFALGIGYATSPTGADHMHNIHDTQFESDEAMNRLAMMGVHENGLPFNDLGPKKVRIAAYQIPWQTLQNGLGICMFTPYGRERTVELLRAVTGWNVNLFELMKAGERILAMARVFNARAGLTPSDDRCPARFSEPLGSGPHEGSMIDEAQMQAAIELYYEMMGWDKSSGAPTTAKLHELGLGEWVEAD